MSDTKWKPDKNGVPMCTRDCPFLRDDGSLEPPCTHARMKALIYGLESNPMICYPQMVKRSEALNAFMEWNSGPDAGMENSQAMWNEAVAKIIDAVTP